MAWVLLLLLAPSALYASFIVGLGMADVTGPACDVNFMGYANPKQVSAGIHLRQWARAFVVAEEKHPERRIAYVSVDFGMGSQAVTREVLRQLEVRYPKQYSLGNLFISGTHTHSGPGGYDQYAIDQLASGGFVPEALHAYSKGIVKAIAKAHDSARAKRQIRFGTGQAEPHSNINRSPTAYMANPASERALYDGNTEQYFELLRFDSSDTSLGMFNWYAVHATSLPNTNLLVSGDNKGYASQLFEEWANPPGTLPGRGEFVAAFASTNLGDVSPNVNGTFCQFSGKPCNEAHSTCFGFTEFCLGRGPGKTAMDSTRIIGERQARAAKTAFESNKLLREVQGGSIVSRHRVVDFSNVTIEAHVAVQLEQVQGGSRSLLSTASTATTTCKSALGYSFAAGTTDGPGAFDFYQGETRGNRFWETIRNFIKVPSQESAQCHHPKPILLPTGEIDFPYAWEPKLLSIGFALVGKSVALLTVPAEFSTMAGRRLKRIVKKKLVDQGLLESQGVVVLSCLTNAYAHYVVTFEEYQVQRYEGASTLFGPHTLAAYIQEFIKLIDGDQPSPFGDKDIPDLVPRAITVLPKPGSDKVPRGKWFGGLALDADPTYTLTQVVAVEFYSANLRHDYRHDDSFLAVELLHGETGEWEVVRTDSSFDTRLLYSRSGRLGGLSVVRVEWHLDAARTAPGTYRISHSASYLSSASNATLQPFTGHSRPFRVG